jgi:hypothetical protein
MKYDNNKLYWQEYFEKNRDKINEYQRNRARAIMTDPEKLLAARKYREEYYKAKKIKNHLDVCKPTFNIIRETRVIKISLL